MFHVVFYIIDICALPCEISPSGALLTRLTGMMGLLSSILGVGQLPESSLRRGRLLSRLTSRMGSLLRYTSVARLLPSLREARRLLRSSLKSGTQAHRRGGATVKAYTKVVGNWDLDR